MPDTDRRNAMPGMTSRLAKRISAEQRRLERLLASQERRVRRAFETFLADARSDDVMREVRQLLEQGRVEPALEVVDSHVVRMGRVIPRVFEEAGDAEAEALAESLGAEASRVAISFDPTNERAARLMRQSRLEFVREFTRSQREATRAAVTEAFSEGLGTQATARRFRDSIGLTSQQLQAVGNYRRMLEQGSREALERELRDRRFDSTVARAAREGEPLSAQQIDRMTERYQQRMLDMRAETIARTESLRTTNAAQEEAFDQVLDQAQIDPSLVEREWRATMDERTRDSHASMNGQIRGKGEPFQSPFGAQIRFPGDPNAPASETINCRCTLVRRIRQADQQQMATAA